MAPQLDKQACVVQAVKLLLAALVGALILWATTATPYGPGPSLPAFTSLRFPTSSSSLNRETASAPEAAAHSPSKAAELKAQLTSDVSSMVASRKFLQPQVEDAEERDAQEHWDSHFDEERFKSYNPFDHTADDHCSLKPGQKKPDQKIPKIIHFIFGLKDDFGGKPFNFVHYTSVMSAHFRIQPEAMYLHHIHEPAGEWWDRCKHLITLVKARKTERLYGHDLNNAAHQADVVRLEVLYRYGGIYMDIDTLVLQPVDALLHHDLVLGYEGDEYYGIGNSVMLAAPGSKFIERWLMSYAAFNGDEWATHSIEIPRRIAIEHPTEVCIMPPHAFHYPLTWTSSGKDFMFTELSEDEEKQVLVDNEALDGKVYQALYPGQYALHTAETGSWDSHLLKYNLEFIQETHTRMAVLMRNIFADLPSEGVS